MQQANVTLENINNGPTDFNSVIERTDKIVGQHNLIAGMEEVDQIVNRQQLKDLRKQKKKNYNLYELFKNVQTLVDTAQPTLDEMFIKDAEGNYVFSPAAEILINQSLSNKELLDEMKGLYIEIDGKADQYRKGFIKEKVIQGRYSRRGAEYASLFNDLGDKIFSLSALCVSLQSIMSDLIASAGEEN